MPQLATRQHARTPWWWTCCPTRAAAVAAAAGEYDAAICAPIGAPRHGLTVLADKIADHADAVTRFALLSRPGAAAAADRRRRDLAGRLHRPRPGRRAARGADRVGGTRDQPDPDRVPADRRAARPLRLLPGLHRATWPRRGSARRCRACAGSAPRCGSSARYPRHRWSAAAQDGPVPVAAGLSDRDFADSAAWLARIRAGEPPDPRRPDRRSPPAHLPRLELWLAFRGLAPDSVQPQLRDRAGSAASRRGGRPAGRRCCCWPPEAPRKPPGGSSDGWTTTKP